MSTDVVTSIPCRDITLCPCRFQLIAPDVATSAQVFCNLQMVALGVATSSSCRDINLMNCSFQLVPSVVATSILCRDITSYLCRFHWSLLVSRHQSSVATTVSVKAASSFQTCHSFKVILLSRPQSLVTTSTLVETSRCCRDIIPLASDQSSAAYLVIPVATCITFPSIFLMSRPHNWTMHTQNTQGGCLSMGEGVSLSLPRNGFPVVNPLVVSVPFSREHGFSGGFSLPVFQEEEGDSLKISLIESNDHVGLTTRGSLFQRRVHPFSLARKLQKWVWRRFHGGFSSRCSIAPKGGYPYASFCSRRSLRSVFLVGANCFGDRPIHIPGSLSPINGKSDDGCLFPSGFRGLGYASTDLLKKEVEHASFAAAGSGAPDVAGKISTVGIVSSWDLDRDLRGSRASDLRLDLLNCIKASPSMEVAGDTRLKAKSWILDPVFKSLLSPARGIRDLFSAGYLLSRGYGFGSLVWASSESGFWVAFLVNTDLVESTLCAMVIFGIICCWRSHGIKTESLFWTTLRWDTNVSSWV